MCRRQNLRQKNLMQTWSSFNPNNVIFFCQQLSVTSVVSSFPIIYHFFLKTRPPCIFFLIVRHYLKKFAFLINLYFCLINMLLNCDFAWLDTPFICQNDSIPAGNYLFKVNNRNTRTRCQICSKLKIKTPERRQASFWCLYF